MPWVRNSRLSAFIQQRQTGANPIERALMVGHAGAGRSRITQFLKSRSRHLLDSPLKTCMLSVSGICQPRAASISDIRQAKSASLV